MHDPLNNPEANPTDKPVQPRVLLIGDSISLGYTPFVQQQLTGRAEVWHPEDNCQDTGYGLKMLREWLGAGNWDVIHFNWGIWDTHYLDNATRAIVLDESALPADRMHVRTTLEQYRRNLTALVEMLQGTGARLIWAGTTAVMCRKGARFDDVAKYNAAALQIMREHGIMVNDLYTFALPHGAEWQAGDGCHFSTPGSVRLAEEVTRCILDALERDNHETTR